jgi:two-component system chemotaxis sensor kinase CheA
MDDLLSEFLTEANESLAGLDEALLTLERAPDDKATVGLIFRLVHTIKGTCGFLGLPRLERVAHSGENVLGLLREGSIAASPGLITAVLAAADVMKEIVATLAATGAEPAGDDQAVIARLDAIYAGETPDGAIAVAPAPSAAPPPTAALTEDVTEAPPPQVLGETARAGSLDATPHDGGIGSQTIRVAVSVLENLMTLVSELVLTRNQLLQISRTSKEAVFTAPVQRLSQITSDLQEGVMKTRMQPIGSAWSKLPRLVRDLSKDLGKPMELRMLGADTEIDRQVLELVRDPLTHMVRNSGDHGLEPVAERRAAGKPDLGTITLNAFHEGGHITVEISDDGRGLPLDRIREKVLSKGLATAAELAAMDDQAIQRFIFHPGFSTAAQVTSVSGRGVGMDVVKTNIEKIGGTIELHSKPGAGTTFMIQIPLTLAIVSALIVESAGERFAIAQSAVAELVHAEYAQPVADGVAPKTNQIVIETLDGTPVLRLRDRLLPLVTLADLLHLHPAVGAEVKRGAYVVVISVGANALGIVVDRVFDTEEIVVKPVAPVLRDIAMFSGNTVLGDGAVIMILDPNGIARASNIVSGAATRTIAAASQTGTQSGDETSILIFRAGTMAPKAVPLSLVARLEQIPADRFESVGGRLVTQYCGKLMPLVAFDAAFSPLSRPDHPVLVFTEGDRSVGLVVDEIVDVVHDSMNVEMGEAQPGLLGTAVVNGAATEVVDTVHWLSQAGQDWFKARPTSGRGASRLLVVEDSAFFRNMLIPALSSAGYHVTAVNGAPEALVLRSDGAMFDAIISDIEMPGMDGLAFVRAARTEGNWTKIPMIALSGRANAVDVEIGLAAGFTHYMAKFDREALLDRLRRCLEPELKQAA